MISQINLFPLKFIKRFSISPLESFPFITKRPSVYPGVKNKRIQFICEFESEDKEPHSAFEITWYEGTPVRQIAQTDILTGKQRIVTLQNTNTYPDDPLFYLGTTVRNVDPHFCFISSMNTYAVSRSKILTPLKRLFHSSRCREVSNKNALINIRWTVFITYSSF